MKKNVLFIVIDSVTNDVIFNKNTSKKCTPFLNDLRSKSVSGDNMYSEAPYTEAALMSLLGSVDTMDNGGYMEKFKNNKCVLEYFRNNGYKVFFNNYYPSICPSYSVIGYDERRYIEGFDFNQLWEYRLKYFSIIFKNEEIKDFEYNILINILEDNFKAWIEYLIKIKTNDIETIMINDCIDKSDININIENLKKEYCIFLKNKKKYLQSIFIHNTEHNLFKIKTYKMTDKVHNDKVRKIVMNNYKDVFNNIAKLNFKKNLIYNKLPIKKISKSLFKGDFLTVKGLLVGYKNSIVDKDLYSRIDTHYDLFKNQRSFYTVSQELYKWLDNNKNKPFMAYVHIDDAHYNENFFTYDTGNLDIINGDFNRVKGYLNNIPKRYKGSITYDLALHYCDNIIKNIFNYLEKNNLLDNTSVVITADHGFSYYFSPIREKYVISSYKENYNVPFIIYDKNIKHKMIDNFCTTKDIPATLLDLANIKIPKEFKGKSLLGNYNGQDHVLLEYMGGGCPDIYRRPINLGVRTKNYFVKLETYINKNFKDNKIFEVYDLIKDPLENNNLYNKKNIELNIKEELQILEKRFNDIREQYK